MWNPPIALTPEEHQIAARTRKARKFFVFLREHRHELLDAPCQDTLTETYSAEPGGKAPVEAGLLALAPLLQASCHVGDRDAVELTVMGYALKAGQLTYDCRYSTMHGMPVTGGRGFRSLKPLWYNGVPP